jgi:hypothetical protein
VRGSRSVFPVAGVTLFRGKASPLRHLPRRTYRVKAPDGPARIENADVDLGGVARVARTSGPRGREWLSSEYRGPNLAGEKGAGGEDLVELYGAEDATVSVTLAGERRARRFSLGEAFRKGQSVRGAVALQVLGKRRRMRGHRGRRHRRRRRGCTSPPAETTSLPTATTPR